MLNYPLSFSFKIIAFNPQIAMVKLRALLRGPLVGPGLEAFIIDPERQRTGGGRAATTGLTASRLHS